MLIVVSLKNLASSNKIMPQVVNKCYYIYVIDILIDICQYYGFVLFLVLTYNDWLTKTAVKGDYCICDLFIPVLN